MKRIIILLIAIAPIFFTGCGGVYSVSSGKADEAAICFVSNDEFDVTVSIDDTNYEITTIKQKPHRRNRDIKKTAYNHITLQPGRHKVIVTKDNNEIYNKEVFISSTETKIIEL